MIQKSGELILQSPYFFLGQFSKFFVPGTQIVGAMHYAGASAPQPLGKFVYQTTLAASSPFGVLAGVTPNGTSVLLVMNAQGTEVSFKLKIQDSAYANVTVPAHSMSTFSWF
jgi:NO-binding membrane sensor protein with MHYT domain